MSGLMGMLAGASRALDAQRFGLDVVGQNMANVNTDGYSKRVAEFASVPPTDRWSAGGGVEIVGARSMRDRIIDRRFREETSAERREYAISEQLGIVEVALGESGASLDDKLDDFFDAFTTLADTPTAATARQEVILQGQSLASAFRDMASRLTAAQRDTDFQVRGGVEQVNSLAERIASLNAALSGTSATSPEGHHLRDEVNRALESLSEWVNVQAVEREGGGFDVALANGSPLVVGDSTYPLGVTDVPPSGLAAITAGGVAVTTSVTGGRLGGLIDVRDRAIPDYLTRLDEMAYAVATEVNTLHQAGFDLAGNPGVAFFQPMGPAGAAMAIGVNPTLTATGGELLVAASSSATAVGDNGMARQLAGLREAKILAGGTATASESWARLVYRVGRDKQAADDAQGTREEITRQLRNLQDSVSGVSLDEEAADLVRFQRAYEANARFFSTIDQTLDTLLNMV